jgi:polysaccharide pyruvyl transferase WcaK-like protein
VKTYWLLRHENVLPESPLKNTANIKTAKKIINDVDVITIREMLSFDELKRLDVDKPVIELTADPALALKVKPAEEVDSLLVNEGVDKSGPLVGISVRKFPGRPKYRSEKYEKVIALTADYLQESYGVKPVFIPMQHDDLSVIDGVIAKMKTTGYVIRNRYSVAQTIGIIGRMEMVIGMRLHALIFAASQSIPIVGMVYDPKIEGFLKYVNQASAGSVKELDFNKLRDISDRVWNKRSLIKEKLQNDIAVLKERALRNASIAIELIENSNSKSKGRDI